MKKTALLVLTPALLMIVQVAKSDYTFGEPTNLGPPINSSFDDGSLTMTPDGLELYFDSGRQGWSLWVTRRATNSDPWGQPEKLWFTAGSSLDFGPCLSANGLELYYSSNRDGAFNILTARRATLSDSWERPVNIGPTVSSWAGDLGPCISTDGLELYFGSERSGGSGGTDLWVTKRETIHDPWGEAVNLGSAVNSPRVDNSPFISPDGLLLFFESNRTDGYGDFDVWVCKRETTKADWGSAANLGPSINSELTEYLPGTSLNGRQFYFVIVGGEGGLGGYDIWQAPIEPVVDFTGDGFVDADDMCKIVDHWGKDEPLLDIGPMPWGDGVVDVEDLIVLSEHPFEQVTDPTLVAHWALDEAEGMIVTDSAGDNNGYALGDPRWESGGGQVNGALQLDGIDDYIVTGSVPNPAYGPLCVFVWVKGGAPGQAIISEPAGSGWLSLEPITGHLMTELTSGGRDGSSLVTETTITDGNWHRIGLVWDGVHRTLYVDGVAAAEDVQDGLVSPGNGFYIGTGKAMAPGTYFSGLIDDVRVYSRAVKP